MMGLWKLSREPRWPSLMAEVGVLVEDKATALRWVRFSSKRSASQPCSSISVTFSRRVASLL
jgi:hypothetical protein